MKQTVNFNSFVQAFKDAGRDHQSFIYAVF